MIYAVDVGSTLARPTTFAWARLPLTGGPPEVSSDISALARSLLRDLEAGRSVALGLEAPLFIPVPRDHRLLSKGRAGERDRAWAAPPGGYVMALAVHQAAWLLRELRSASHQGPVITCDPDLWTGSRNEIPLLFLWEAFISGPAHSSHQRDAATAAAYFQEQQDELKTAVTAQNPFSLIGAAVLWSGWSTDLAWLHGSSVVLRPQVPYSGKIRAVELI